MLLWGDCGDHLKTMQIKLFCLRDIKLQEGVTSGQKVIEHLPVAILIIAKQADNYRVISVLN